MTMTMMMMMMTLMVMLMVLMALIAYLYITAQPSRVRHKKVGLENLKTYKLFRSYLWSIVTDPISSQLYTPK